VETNPVRSQTDEQVLRALTEHRRLTRAELAAEIGISKPTTGERTPGGRGMGRVGQYYALADPGSALVIGIAPTGIAAELIDAYGITQSRATAPINRPARPADVVRALRSVTLSSCTRSGVPPTQKTAEAVTNPAPPPPPARPAPSGEPVSSGMVRPRLAVVSAADPVDRASGRLVQLPDAPFLVGSLDPVAVLSEFVDGPVVVDNDVNWAARAEPASADFAYLFLGEGLGCAIVNDGRVQRGHSGLGGEIAHVLTTGPRGRATPFIEVFGALGLGRAGSSAIDVPRLLAASPEDRALIGKAAAGVIAAVVALADPAEIVLGGPWGPPLLVEIIGAVAGTPRPLPIRAAKVTGDASLAAARQDALSRLRTLIVSSR
jgi:predicted NBD/HSP70 family sugar kinase